MAGQLEAWAAKHASSHRGALAAQPPTLTAGAAGTPCAWRLLAHRSAQGVPAQGMALPRRGALRTGNIAPVPLRRRVTARSETHHFQGLAREVGAVGGGAVSDAALGRVEDVSDTQTRDASAAHAAGLSVVEADPYAVKLHHEDLRGGGGDGHEGRGVVESMVRCQQRAARLARRACLQVADGHGYMQCWLGGSRGLKLREQRPAARGEPRPGPAATTLRRVSLTWAPLAVSRS